jgi:capsular polysaccharide biosynthesis protein
MLNTKYPKEKIDYYYFSKLNNFQKQTLKILNINKNNFINSDTYRHIKAKTLLAVTHPNYFKNTFFYAQSNLPEWIVKYIKKTFLKKNIKKKSKFQKIFINRNDSKKSHCKFINNIEIIKFLKKRNFKILELSKLNFSNQISIFNNAKIIISPHGAGLTNLIFCRKGTKVFEFKPITNKNLLFKRISKINKLVHRTIYLKNVKNNKNGDMFLKLENLLKYL